MQTKTRERIAFVLSIVAMAVGLWWFAQKEVLTGLFMFAAGLVGLMRPRWGHWLICIWFFVQAVSEFFWQGNRARGSFLLAAAIAFAFWEIYQMRNHKRS